MANETPLTIVGNLTADPELRYTQSGTPVASFTVASTPRRLSKQSGEWEDGDPLFMPCTVWRAPAEHAAQSLTKGMRVIVVGRLKQSNWETDDGQKRSRIVLDVDEVAPSLRYATATIAKVASTAQQQAAERWGIDPTGEEPF